MKRIDFDQVLFAVKLFIAAMMAYFISVHLALPQTYWAVVTCCVVMNPVTGGVRSKAVYRFTGTFLAGVSGLAMSAAFDSVTVLMVVGSGVLVTVAFAFSMTDRTPRAYGAQLYAITLLLVVIGSLDHPEAMFDTAVARVCEIGLGVFCSAVVDSAIAPRSLSAALKARLQRAMSAMEPWLYDMLDPDIATEKIIRDRNRILADLTSMSVLIAQLRYDPMVTRWERQCGMAVQQKLLRLVSILPSIASYANHLPESDRAGASEWLSTARLMVGKGAGASEAFTNTVVAKDAAENEPVIRRGSWRDSLLNNLTESVTDALTLWADVNRIAGSLLRNEELPRRLRTSVWRTREFKLRPDFYLVTRLGGGVLLSYALLMAIWWATGWPQGANAVILGIVAVGFFGSADEAGKAIGVFAKFALISILIAGLLSYGLLPLTDGFPSFVMAMGVVMVPLGLWAAKDPMAVLLLALALSSINLQASYSPLDFDHFVDNGLSTMIGVLVAQSCIQLVRQMGTAHRIKRFVRQEIADIVGLTRHAGAGAGGAYTLRALDRAASIGARTVPNAAAPELAIRPLDWIQVGVAVAMVRHAASQVGGLRRRSCDALLTQLRHELTRNTAPSDTLRDLLDAALATAHRRSQGRSDALVRGLIALRLFLFTEKRLQAPLSGLPPLAQ